MRGALGVGAVSGQGVAGEGVDADAETDGEPGGGQFFQDLEVDLVGLVTATVDGVVRKSQKSGLGQEGEDLSREDSGFLLLGRPGSDLLRHDVADERDELPGLLGGQTAFHRLRGTVGHDGALLPVGRCGGRALGVGEAPPGDLPEVTREKQTAPPILPFRVTGGTVIGCGGMSMPDRMPPVTGVNAQAGRPGGPADHRRIGPNH